MKLSEYIEILQSYSDQDARVMKPGYEGGYNDLKGYIDVVEVALDVNTEWYYGKHESVDSYKVNDQHKKEIVLILS